LQLSKESTDSCELRRLRAEKKLAPLLPSVIQTTVVVFDKFLLANAHFAPCSTIFRFSSFRTSNADRSSRYPSDAEDFRFSNANSGSESYLVSYVTAETRSTSLDIYWCDGCYLQVSCATGWRRIDKVSGIVRKSTTAVTTLSSFVPMPLGQHGS